MSTQRYKLPLAGMAFLALPVLAFAGPKSVPSKKHIHVTVKSAASVHSKSVHAIHHHEFALAEMPPERATQIQAALIKQGYMTGDPTGSWDAPTISAMQKLQGDNGWQTKVTPDSRALIKLGLGPNSDAAASIHPQDLAQATNP